MMRNKKQQQYCLIISIPLLLLTVFASRRIFWSSSNPSLISNPSKLQEKTAFEGVSKSSSTAADKEEAKSEIEQGVVGDVAYYHCKTGSSGGSSSYQNLVLLHGAAFTKENWKGSGILDLLCNNKKQLPLQVTAVDLSVQVTGLALVQFLGQLHSHQLVTEFPIVLVTPSASGKAIVDWAQSSSSSIGGGAGAGGNKFPPLSEFVSTWIPVASNSVSSVSPPSLLSTLFPNVDILAIYGNRDSSGKASMTLLQEHQAGSRTKLVELHGTHPVYLDAPQAFVDTVLEHMLQNPIQT